MAVRTRQEVSQFLFDMKAKLMLNKIDNLYLVPRKDKKNQNCMIELGLRHNDVADILLKLKVENYSETVKDDKFPENFLWVFGITYK